MKGAKKEKNNYRQTSSKNIKANQEQKDPVQKISQEKPTLEFYALNVLKMKENEARKNIKAFRLIDKNNSGLVNKEEFRNLLDKYNFGINWTHETMNSMFDEIDENKSGKICDEEFLKYMSDENRNRNLSVMVDILVRSEREKEVIEESIEVDPKIEKIKREKDEILRRQEIYRSLGPEEYARVHLNIDTRLYQKYIKTFDLMDLNDNENISRFEFKALLKQFSLGMNLTKEEAKGMFDTIDRDQDGEINLQDFLESLNRNNSNKQLLGIIEEVNRRKKEIKEYKCKNIRWKSRGLKKNKEKVQIEGSTIDEKTLEKYKDIFYVLASEIKGTFNQNQYKSALKLHASQAGTDDKSPEKVSQSFNQMDTNKDGNVSLVEFVQSVIKGDNKLLNSLVDGLLKFELAIKNSKDSESVENAVKYAENVLKMSPQQIEKCKKAFSLIDADQSGELNLSELSEIINTFDLMPGATSQDITNLFQELDDNKNERIGLKEFFEGISDLKRNEKLERLVATIYEREHEMFNYKVKANYWNTRSEVMREAPMEGEKIKRSVFLPEEEQEIEKGWKTREFDETFRENDEITFEVRQGGKDEKAKQSRILQEEKEMLESEMIEKMKEAESRFHNKLEELREVIKKKDLEIQMKETEIRESLTNQNAIETRIKGFEDQLETMKKQNKIYLEENFNLNKVNEGLKQQIGEFEKSKQELLDSKNKIKSLEERILGLEKEKEKHDLIKKIDEGETLSVREKAKLFSSVPKSDTGKSPKRSSKSKTTIQEGDALNEESNNAQETKQSKDQFEDIYFIKEENESLKEKLIQLGKANDELKGKIETLNTERINIRNQEDYGKLNQEKAQLEIEMEKTMKQLEFFSNAVNNLEKENKQLIRNIQDIQKQLLEISEERKIDSSNYKTQETMILQQVSTLKQKIEELEKINKELGEKNHSWELGENLREGETTRTFEFTRDLDRTSRLEEGPKKSRFIMRTDSEEEGRHIVNKEILERKTGNPENLKLFRDKMTGKINLWKSLRQFRKDVGYKLLFCAILKVLNFKIKFFNFQRGSLNHDDKFSLSILTLITDGFL